MFNSYSNLKVFYRDFYGNFGIRYESWPFFAVRDMKQRFIWWECVVGASQDQGMDLSFKGPEVIRLEMNNINELIRHWCISQHAKLLFTERNVLVSGW